MGIRNSNTEVCWLGSDGKVDARRYSTSDPDAGKVDTTITSFDPIKEVGC